MKFSVDMEGKNEKSFQGGGAPEPGKYHAVVASVDSSCSERDALLVVFRILAGTVDDQRGKRLTESFWLSERARPRLEHLALVTGLVSPGEKKSIDFMDAVGADLVIEVIEEEYTTQKGDKRKSRKMSYAGMWHPRSEQVRDVPRGEPPQEKPSAESSSPPADDEYGDL